MLVHKETNKLFKGTRSCHVETSREANYRRLADLRSEEENVRKLSATECHKREWVEFEFTIRLRKA